MEIFNLSECSEAVQSAFDQTVKKLDDPKYETLFNGVWNGKHFKLLAKGNRKNIKEVVLITTGEKKYLAHMKGRIPKNWIENYLHNQKI